MTKGSFKATPLMIEIRHYVSETGNDHYQQWLDHLKDRTAKARITVRVNRLSAGAFGDCKPLCQGVWELRIDHGPGYRLYYAQDGKKLVLLRLGGDKRQQQADIDKAVRCWNAYQKRKP
ncbi:type II toxin-antitoxin system RelE/ParE family toxin [Pseudomonas sp. ML2-2023-6]|uniref:type II toxin-antitoxin system RelE/ParE family toxin n=1 Tax=Pseudomonas sp. ML2-2023-6 TaxID=3122376 RepID=UPI0030CAD255